jgi:hypothetical protein
VKYSVINFEPYTAQHQLWRNTPDGTLRQEWQDCRVMGIVMKDDEPHYLIETYDRGERFLELVDSVRTIN